MINAETDYTTCPGCGDRVAFRWNNGFVSDLGTALIADWVYHSVCWDDLVRRYPPDAPEERFDDGAKGGTKDRR